MNTLDLFFEKFKLSSNDINIHQLVTDFIKEMNKGLHNSESSLRMLPTYIEADNKFNSKEAVLAIDAGGTNLRKALVSAENDSKLEIKGLKKYRMPATERELSKTEFFETIAEYVKNYATDVEKIGFCFSYPTEIYPNKDGKLLQFCKEVQAPEVIGEFIGKNLLDALNMPQKKIILLNDTVATLLAGKSANTNKSYDSYIGFILGTGTNTSYVEENANILKNKDLDKNKSQIINIESGNFSIIPRSIIDEKFDAQTNNPGNYIFEKMFSGAYFGGLCLAYLQAAADEGLFSAKTAKNLNELLELSTLDVTNFLEKSKLSQNPLYEAITMQKDDETCIRIIQKLIERSGKLVAANLAAVILKTEKGKDASRPILITIEGTTYYKLPGLQQSVQNSLTNYLTGDKQRYLETVNVENASLLGGALAALVN